ncbi:GIY-YIG catalytic domain-containing protein [Chitinophaga skermanii]|uniref:GIY-YIG catalytic domain-containing protein n=1 Tax=Chitinophaga skermanii TaxID=331697 RepID=A0A327QD88_9BACT|nr:GIY-YIG nuclease family protein [Chitinophaga skermanii]RAJ02440.1 GIY-YIG catalytic domain-containing protein [Chitinophaga skermanii]
MSNRKELINAYKQRDPQIGIYQVRNTVNNKVYVASSMSLETVWNSQQFQLRSNGHPFEALQVEWNEFGADKFVFEILATLKPEPTMNVKFELKALEKKYIDQLQPYGAKGYHSTLYQ